KKIVVGLARFVGGKQEPGALRIVHVSHRVRAYMEQSGARARRRKEAVLAVVWPQKQPGAAGAHAGNAADFFSGSGQSSCCVAARSAGERALTIAYDGGIAKADELLLPWKPGG